MKEQKKRLLQKLVWTNQPVIPENASKSFNFVEWNITEKESKHLARAPTVPPVFPGFFPHLPVPQEYLELNCSLWPRLLCPMVLTTVIYSKLFKSLKALSSDNSARTISESRKLRLVSSNGNKTIKVTTINYFFLIYYQLLRFKRNHYSYY